MPTPSIVPHLTVVHHLLDSTTDVLVAVRHGGTDHYLLVSVERAQPSESTVSMLPEPPSWTCPWSVSGHHAAPGCGLSAPWLSAT
jgi:hypothetical protein